MGSESDINVSVGVIKALYERNLLPRVISGASAGSLMAAAVGTMTDEEFMHVRESRVRLFIRFMYL